MTRRRGRGATADPAGPQGAAEPAATLAGDAAPEASTGDDDVASIDDRSRLRGLLDAGRGRATILSGRALDLANELRARSRPLDVAGRVVERDRDAFGSVLGSAIALRLFLFTLPALVFAVATVHLVLRTDQIDDLGESAGVASTMVDQIEGAVGSSGVSVGLVLSGLLLALWAGRSLTRVLAASSAGAWRVEARDAKVSMRTVGLVTAMVFALLIVGAVLSRLRQEYGITVATGSLAITIVTAALGWFFVTWTLPRATPDPGALLPGAAVVGVGLAGVQWFMQFYLPDKVAESSELMGDLGLAVALLAYFFVVGRLLAFSVVIDAVVFEEIGSVSEFVFGLPGVRRVPERYPQVGRFFDLPVAGLGTSDDVPEDRAALGGSPEA